MINVQNQSLRPSFWHSTMTTLYGAKVARCGTPWRPHDCARRNQGYLWAMTPTEHPWSVTVRLDEVPEAGRHVVLEASDHVRAALARPAGVDAIDRLVASFDLSRRGRDRLHVAGVVSATVRQTCVVSLEPITNTVEEAIDIEFAPPQSGEADPLDPEASSGEESEPLVGGAVDLGHLAAEFLTLGVDPYPRKADVAFEPPAERADPASHPFAALAGWKKPQS